MPIAHKSAISVGMLYVPVSLHKTTRETGISFNQLCKDDSGNHQRIKYQKICPSCNKEIKASDIIKGYEYEKGKYVTITEDELERIKTKKDKTIHIIYFTKLTEIDPILFDKDYYLAPLPGADKAYELLRQALLSTKKAAVAKTVLGNKEELVVLYPTKYSIIAKMIFFQEEIQPVPNIPKVQLDKKELEMAKSLITSMTEPFNHDEFADEYQIKLREAIQTKINGQEIVTAGSDQQTTAIDLISALQQTLEMANNHSIPS